MLANITYFDLTLMFDWNSVADSFNDVPENRFEILSPVIRDVMSRRKVKSMLDYGCGDGRFLSHLLGDSIKPDSLELALLEPSSTMFGLANERWGDQARVVKSAAELPAKTYDAVMQVMECPFFGRSTRG